MNRDTHALERTLKQDMTLFRESNNPMPMYVFMYNRILGMYDEAINKCVENKNLIRHRCHFVDKYSTAIAKENGKEEQLVHLHSTYLSGVLEE